MRQRPEQRRNKQGCDSLHRDSGLTLIELVAAMALFALLAVMGLQALTTGLRQRDHLAALDQEVAEASLGLALLRNDLAAMVPLLFHPPGGGRRSALHLSRDGRSLGLSIGGQSDLPPLQTRGLHRVQWRLEPGSGRLLRRVWPVLTPASASAAQPEVAYFSTVRSFTLRSHWPQLGWVDGADSGVLDSAPEPEAGDSDGGLVAQSSLYSDTLPQAVELTLQIDGLGPVRLLQVLQ